MATPPRSWHIWPGHRNAAAVAVIGKAAGDAPLEALRTHGWSERSLVAFGMIPRGEVTLIIASLDFEQGPLSHHIFVAPVLVTIALTIPASLLMTPFTKRIIAADAASGQR